MRKCSVAQKYLLRMRLAAAACGKSDTAEHEQHGVRRLGSGSVKVRVWGWHDAAEGLDLGGIGGGCS